MNTKNYFKQITILALILFIGAGISLSQTVKFPAPRQEKLLNELDLLIWNAPDAEKVTVKLRIHKGAAFDRQDREGTMAVLANALFPNRISREFFEEDLGGSLEIESNYDYIQINATAGSDKVLDALQTIAAAVTNPQIDKETTALVKQAQIEKVKLLESDPAYVADRAVASRLFGSFPYGRPEMGSLESLEKIDFADLIFAKDRFLTSDNATLVVIGNVKPDLIYRAARRYFGSWIKSDGKIPSTFRLPDAPDIEPLEINADFGVIESRYALEAVARNDKRFFAGRILEKVLQARFQEISRQSGLKSAAVKLNANLIKGALIFSKQLDPDDLPLGAPVVSGAGEENKEPVKTENFITGLLKQPVAKAEFDQAKSEVLSDFRKKAGQLDGLSEIWLDLQTYKLDSLANELKQLEQVTITDVQKLAGELQTNSIVTVDLF